MSTVENIEQFVDTDTGDSEYENDTLPMAGKMSEKNPNFEGQIDGCKCVDKCNTESCPCLKFGKQCNYEDESLCGCSSCENILNHLNHFFGDEKCTANPCFLMWLRKTGTGLKSINRNALLERIIRSESYSKALDDDDGLFATWAKKWKKIKRQNDENVKMAHTQKFFRMVFSDTSGDKSNYYYSFCYKDLCHDDYNWHCITCGKCERWNFWHCGTCDECTYGNTLACEGCGGCSQEAAYL